MPSLLNKKAPTFRHQMYDEYKATRKETPAELVGQFGRVRELVQAFDIPIFEMEGFEADDLPGVRWPHKPMPGASKPSSSPEIADLMQLVNEKTTILYPKARGSFGDADKFDAAAVMTKYGIGPEHIADYKALKGDTSDNIPGVKGIGEVTAVKLIQKFGGIEQIYGPS